MGISPFPNAPTSRFIVTGALYILLIQIMRFSTKLYHFTTLSQIFFGDHKYYVFLKIHNICHVPNEAFSSVNHKKIFQ